MHADIGKAAQRELYIATIWHLNKLNRNTARRRQFKPVKIRLHVIQFCTAPSGNKLDLSSCKLIYKTVPLSDDAVKMPVTERKGFTFAWPMGYERRVYKRLQSDNSTSRLIKLKELHANARTI